MSRKALFRQVALDRLQAGPEADAPEILAPRRPGLLWGAILLAAAALLAWFLP